MQSVGHLLLESTFRTLNNWKQTIRPSKFWRTFQLSYTLLPVKESNKKNRTSKYNDKNTDEKIVP